MKRRPNPRHPRNPSLLFQLTCQLLATVADILRPWRWAALPKEGPLTMKVVQRTYNVVTIADLEALIESHYGRPFSLDRDQLMPIVALRFVASKTPLTQDELRRLASFRARTTELNDLFHDVLVPDLCIAGCIAPGEYLVVIGAP